MYWKKYVWTMSVTGQGKSLGKIPMDFPTCRFSLPVVTVVSSRCKQTCPLQAAVLKEEVATYHQTSRLFFNILCWKTPPSPSHQQSCPFWAPPDHAPKTSCSDEAIPGQTSTWWAAAVGRKLSRGMNVGLRLPKMLWRLHINWSYGRVRSISLSSGQAITYKLQQKLHWR